jgi:predicted NAD/FAD-binding protein
MNLHKALYAFFNKRIDAMGLKDKKDLNVAVVGSGISGICAAYLLQHRHSVSLFEKNDYFGGHTHTIEIPHGPDKGLPVDTGFIVLNQRTYPNFIEFLNQLGVEKCPTQMDFSYYCRQTGLCYASRNLNTLFAQRSNLFKPDYLLFVYEMIQFLGKLRRTYLTDRLDDITLAQYVKKNGLHRGVVDQFIIPMAAAIWSGSDFQMGKFPVRTFAQFYENHGLLGISGHPPWFFVKGGSHTYVKAFLKSFKGRAVASSKIVSITRTASKPTLHFENRESQTFDAVILAIHADQALNLLASPTRLERQLLGVWTYSHNRTLLHTDTTVMPPNPRAWASWNYTRHSPGDTTAPVMVSYDMTRLQKLDTQRSYFVTLNPREPIPDDHVIKEMDYTHPQYSFAAFNSQKDLPGLNENQHTFFCGSYFGYGFHEDGVRSAVQVAEKFGVAL